MKAHHYLASETSFFPAALKQGLVRQPMVAAHGNTLNSPIAKGNRMSQSGSARTCRDCLQQYALYEETKETRANVHFIRISYILTNIFHKSKNTLTKYTLCFDAQN